MDARFVFNVVIAGGTAYVSCFEYLKTISKLVSGKFAINAYINEHTFYDHEHLVDEIRGFAHKTKGIISSVRPFGNLLPETNGTKQVINGIMLGKGLAYYTSFSSKTIIRREMKKL